MGQLQSVLSYLGYQNFVYKPKAQEAKRVESSQFYFDLANNSESDSLFKKSLSGGEGKYGFLDILKIIKVHQLQKLPDLVLEWLI